MRLKTGLLLALLGAMLVAPAEAQGPTLADFNKAMKFVGGRDYVVVIVQRPDGDPVNVWWYRDQRMTEVVCRRDRLEDWAAGEKTPRLPDWRGLLACSAGKSLIIATAGAAERTMDHEWCHIYGWAADHPSRKPAACEAKPWRAFPGAMSAPDHIRARWSTDR